MKTRRFIIAASVIAALASGCGGHGTAAATLRDPYLFYIEHNPEPIMMSAYAARLLAPGFCHVHQRPGTTGQVLSVAYAGRGGCPSPALATVGEPVPKWPVTP
jgi:hypothetical protein